MTKKTLFGNRTSAIDRYLAADAGLDGKAPAAGGGSTAAADEPIFRRCDAVMALTPSLADSAEIGWAFEEARRIARSGPRRPETSPGTPWYLSPWPAWSMAGALAVGLLLTTLPRAPEPPLPAEGDSAAARVTFAPILVSADLARTLAEIQPVVLLANEMPVDARSLAVLPFAEAPGAGSASDGAAVADALYRQLVRQLRSVPGLYLIDTATAAVYSNSELPPEEIAIQLGVRGVVEGRVDSIDGDIRFELRFTDAAIDGASIRQAIKRPTAELAELQTDIASSVLGALTRPASITQSSGTL